MTESGQAGSAATEGTAGEPVPDPGSGATGTAGAGAAPSGADPTGIPADPDPGVLTGPSVTAGSDAGAEEPAGTLAPPAPATGTTSPGPIVTDPAFTPPPTDYTDAGVPSLDFVRDKIEGRYANALGSAELAEAVIPEVKSMQDKAAERDEAARDKLEAIRRSMRGESES